MRKEEAVKRVPGQILRGKEGPPIAGLKDLKQSKLFQKFLQKEKEDPVPPPVVKGSFNNFKKSQEALKSSATFNKFRS